MLKRKIKIDTKLLCIIALVVIPVIYILIAYLPLHFTVIQRIQPYLNVISLFTGVEINQEAQETRNLLEMTADLPKPDTVKVWDEAASSYINMIPQSEIIIPSFGDVYGRLTITGTKVDTYVLWDDTRRELNRGVGTFTGSWLPGFGRTVMLTGYRGTSLLDLSVVKIGQTIMLETHYGTYMYEIVRFAIYRIDDDSSYDLSRNDENIIIYTWYPFNSIKNTDFRFFVYGNLVSGTQVDTSQ